MFFTKYLLKTLCILLCQIKCSTIKWCGRQKRVLFISSFKMFPDTKRWNVSKIYYFYWIIYLNRKYCLKCDIDYSQYRIPMYKSFFWHSWNILKRTSFFSLPHHFLFLLYYSCWFLLFKSFVHYHTQHNYTNNCKDMFIIGSTFSTNS